MNAATGRVGAAAPPARRREASPPAPWPAKWRIFAAWWGPLLIALAALAMLRWTWGTWPDVLVDFGRERYVPWRLMEGDVLYRDLAVYNGPLSPYFNALCFRLFGASLRTLVCCNLALLVLLIALVYGTLRKVGSQFAATVACLLLVLLFAFGQLASTGNYNYVCPYSHEMTHGLLLSLLAVVAAWPAGNRRRLRLVLSGLALGLSFLTKAEVFLPGATATAAVLLLGLWFQRPPWRAALAELGCFVVPLCIPPLAAFGALSAFMPAEQALLGTLGSWSVAVRNDFTNSPFYRGTTGMDAPLHNAWLMASTTCLYGLVLLPAGLLGATLRRPGPYRLATAGTVFGVVGLLLWHCRTDIDWNNIARPLPVLIVAALVAVTAAFLPHRREAAAQGRFLRQVSLLIFAFVLLGNMLLCARIYHYGFLQAMPATLLLAVAGLDWVPGFIDRRGGYGGVFAAVATSLLSIIVLVHLIAEASLLATKTQWVGKGADGFWADARGAFVNAMVAEIARQSSADTTLAVLPEGVMINCLSGLRNPTPYLKFMPLDLLLFDEDRIVERFRAHPPD